MSSKEQLNQLILLCHRRWTLPVLVELDRLGGVRLVKLQHALNVAPETARRALTECMRLKLVQRNPGYGHPLRPEFVLTEQGARVAAACRALFSANDRVQAEWIGKKWSLPVLAAVFSGATRFSEIRALLPLATPRALTQALDSLRQAGCLLRSLVDAKPPGTRYVLTDSGSSIAEQAHAIACVRAADE